MTESLFCDTMGSLKATFRLSSLGGPVADHTGSLPPFLQAPKTQISQRPIAGSPRFHMGTLLNIAPLPDPSSQAGVPNTHHSHAAAVQLPFKTQLSPTHHSLLKQDRKNSHVR